MRALTPAIAVRRVAALLGASFAVSAPLTIVGVATLALTAATAVGVVVDSRVVTGAPVWLKPTKFAISIAIYCFSFAWVLSHLRTRPRLVRWVGGVIAWSLAVEMVIIAVQAARGTTSHFNVGTPLDTVMFSIMGWSIVLLWMASLAAAVALFQTRFDDQARGWALRLGLGLTVVGSALGGFMLGPTAEQLDAARRPGGTLVTAGAHTVGGSDGGPGLPGTNWSTQHGDLRVAHFLGLHALQFIPLVGWLAARARRLASERDRVRAVWVATASYAGLMLLLLWQALRGQSIVAPDVVTAFAFAAWAALTALGAGAILLAARRTGGAGAPRSALVS